MCAQFYSAGYSGSRLCREGQSPMAPIVGEGLDKTIFFTSGWKFNLFYTEDKKWYGGGDNEFGQLDASTLEIGNLGRITALDFLTPKWAACGDKFVAIVSTDGDLYTMGANYGNRINKVQFDDPKTKIRFIGCGTETIVAIPEGPGIIFWTTPQATPVFSNNDTNFIDCAAGQYHFIALSEDGTVYTWGRRKACGQGRKFRSDKPKKCNIEGCKFTNVFAYNTSSFAIDTDGNIWSSGLSNYGQLGLGTTRKTNVFMRIETFSTAPIVHIAVGDTMAYFLNNKGELFSAGEPDNSRLLMDHNDHVRVPKLCTATANLKVSYMSTGCSHIIFATNMKKLIHHPILVGNNFTSKHVQILKNISISPSQTITVDVSPAGFACYGFYPGDIVVQTNSKVEAEVIGFGSDTSIFVKELNEAGAYKIYKEKDPIMFHPHLKVVRRAVPDSSIFEAEGRSTFKFVLDKSTKLCSAFGMYVGEEVEHQDFGKGVVKGIFGSRVFFSWEFDKENGKDLVSTGLSNNLEELHRYIQIKTPINRQLIHFPEINNIEISPCDMLKQYNILPNDFVCVKSSYGIVIGQLAHYCIVNDIITKELTFSLPSSIQLLRRKSDSPVIIPHLAIDGSVIDVDVSYSSLDSFIPCDRIWCNKGFATYIGKTDKGVCLLTDDSLRLNLGVGILSELKNSILINRIGASMPNDEAKICGPEDLLIDTFISKGLIHYPGDIIQYEDKQYIVVGFEKDNLVIRSLDDLTKIALGKNKWENISFVCKFGNQLAKRVYTTKWGYQCMFEVSSSLFEGMRVLPGDYVKTPYGNAKIVGMLNGDVWYHVDEDKGAICFQQQTSYDHTQVIILSKVGHKFKYEPEPYFFASVA